MNFPFCGIGKLKLPTTNNSYLQTFILFNLACVLDLCCGHTHAHAHVHANIQAHAHAHTHAHIQTHTHTQTHANARAPADSHTHTHITCTRLCHVHCAQVYW